MVETLSGHLTDWTLAEAKYWAYEAAFATHDAVTDAAQATEATLLTIKENKADLVGAANNDVDAAQRRVEMA